MPSFPVKSSSVSAGAASPLVQSSLISVGADILSGAFGGSPSNARREKDLRSQYSIARQYSGSGLPNYVKNAQKAGLHPLFAMGSSAGQSPTFNMQGQSPSGSFASDGLRAVSRHYSRMAEYEAKKDLINAQAQASALRVAENNTSNDTDGALVRDAVARAIHPTERVEGKILTSDGREVTIPKGTPAGVLEEEIGEWADWMPDTLRRSYQVFKGQLQNPDTVKAFRAWARSKGLNFDRLKTDAVKKREASKRKYKRTSRRH